MLRAMAEDLLSELYALLEDDLDGMTLTPDGLRALAECRYGEVQLAIDHDPESEMLRVSTLVPPPAGSGPAFLVWCLTINARYWDVKLGLDPEGSLLVHSDLDTAATADLDDLSAAVIERVDAVVDLLDDDLVEHLLATGFGTPHQRERWIMHADAVEDDA